VARRLRASAPRVASLSSLCLSVLAGLALAAAPLRPAAAAPTEQVHSLTWYVHVDLVGGAMDLAFYQSLIASRLAQANLQLRGEQGPFDNGCCARLESVSVSTFGTAGDGLDVVLNATQFAALQAFGAGAYLIQTLNYCGGSISPTLLGCATTPGDFLVVAFDAESSGKLGSVIGHERGHNAGLNHVSANDCQLMRAGNGGGCLTVSECNAYLAKADSTGSICACLDDTVGDPPLADGTSCGTGLVCSGGACDDESGLAGSSLLAAGGAGAYTGETPDDFLPVSALTGGWSDGGAIGAEVTGVAVDEDSDTLYAVESLPGDDALVILDEKTGVKLSTVGTLSSKEVVTALAHDPTGDRLFGIEFDDDFFGTDCQTGVGVPGPCFSELFEIDPGDASITVRGELNTLIIADGVTGLAWDDAGGVLYGSTRAGLFIVDVGSCNGSTCGTSQVDNTFRDPSGLTWDPNSGKLLREGGDGFGVTLLDVIDPGSGVTESSIGVDPFTIGGLAARPVPEPGGAAGLLAGAALLRALARRRAGEPA